jgi:hypothetical protein
VNPEPERSPGSDGLRTGYVYLALMKVGREKRFKIGKANLVEQRTKQVAVNLPERCTRDGSVRSRDGSRGSRVARSVLGALG